MDTIHIENLTRDYGGGKGIFDVSFQVGTGEVFGFLGPNGAGKTTTIRHLMGFIKPQAGSCTIKDMDCWKYRDKIRLHTGRDQFFRGYDRNGISEIYYKISKLRLRKPPERAARSL